MGAFDLRVTETLHIEGRRPFLDFPSEVRFCVLSTQFLYVLSDASAAGGEFVANIMDDEVSIPGPPRGYHSGHPVAACGGRSMEGMSRISFTFGVGETRGVWEKSVRNFF